MIQRCKKIYNKIVKSITPGWVLNGTNKVKTEQL